MPAPDEVPGERLGGGPGEEPASVGLHQQLGASESTPKLGDSANFRWTVAVVGYLWVLPTALMVLLAATLIPDWKTGEWAPGAPTVAVWLSSLGILAALAWVAVSVLVKGSPIGRVISGLLALGVGYLHVQLLDEPLSVLDAGSSTRPASIGSSPWEDNAVALFLVGCNLVGSLAVLVLARRTPSGAQRSLVKPYFRMRIVVPAWLLAFGLYRVMHLVRAVSFHFGGGPEEPMYYRAESMLIGCALAAIGLACLACIVVVWRSCAGMASREIAAWALALVGPLAVWEAKAAFTPYPSITADGWPPTNPHAAVVPVLSAVCLAVLAPFALRALLRWMVPVSR